jgi:hypothetical protein
VREALAGPLVCALVAVTAGCGSGGSDPEATSVVSIPSVTQPTITQPSAPTLNPETQGQTSTTGAGPSAQADSQERTGRAAIESCPAQMSKQQCRELVQAIKRGGSSNEPLSCAQLGKDLCEEIMRQLGRHP